MINKLVANIKKTGAPMVLGQDRRLSYLKRQAKKRELTGNGENKEGE